MRTRSVTATAPLDETPAPRPSGSALPDGELTARVLGGDSGAFEVLVRKYQGSLLRRARWMGLDPDTASDLVQDAFVKAYTNLANCRDGNCFGAWIGRILRNAVLDYLKSMDRRGVPVPHSLPANWGDPGVEEARGRLREVLKGALAALPLEQREAFLLKHGEGCSYEEMAEMADTSVSAMKMRVHRAREALMGVLGPMADDFGV